MEAKRIDQDPSKPWWAAGNVINMDGYYDEGDVDEDGWTPWVAPVRSHANLCCDCGLVYEVEFAAIDAENRDVRTASVGFRMRQRG